MRIQIHTTHSVTVDVQAVLFDLDGTLVESTGLITDILKNWAIEENLDVTQVLNFCNGKRTQDIVAQFITGDLVDQHYRALTQNFLEVAGDSQPIEGAVAFIQQLNAKHVPWAVVSSSERELIYARMDAVGLPRPDCIVAAEDITQGKPHPEGYLKAAKMLGIDIQECLVFEDSPAGVLAAQAAGAQLCILQETLEENSIQNFTQIYMLIERD